MKKKSFNELFEFLSERQKTHWLLVLFLGIVGSIVELLGVVAVVPLISLLVDFDKSIATAPIKLVYVFVGSPDNDVFIKIFALATIFVVIGSSLISLLNTYFRSRFSWSVRADVSGRIFSWYQFARAELIESMTQAEYFRSIETISKIYVDDIILNFQDILVKTSFLIFVAGFLLTVNPTVTAIVILTIGMSYLLIFKFLRTKLSNITGENYRTEKEIYQLISTGYRACKQLKVDSLENYMGNRFNETKKLYANRSSDFDVMATVPKTVIESSGVVVMLFVAVLMYNRGNSSAFLVSNLALFAACAYRTLPSAQQIYHGVARISSAIKIYEHSRDIWREVRCSFERSRYWIDENFSGNRIRFDNVSYKYPNSTKYIFKDYFLDIPLGGTLLLSDASGAGKSTFVELLLGIRFPQKGNIFIGDKRLSEINASSWLKCVSYVPQEYYMFGESLIENIAGLSHPLDRGRLEAVLNVCGLNAVLNKKNISPKTFIGENANTFSGGERARVAIASALYRQSKVIVLDEALSNLDERSARELLENIRKYNESVVIIIISHNSGEIGIPCEQLVLS